MGPVVKMIMDHPRCAQLQEGDVLLEVNGENVRNYVHNELVTVLKRCPKGNQASFVVLRQPNEVTDKFGRFSCPFLGLFLIHVLGTKFC